MANWLKNFRQRLLERIGDFLWGQWTSLGVSGTVELKRSWVCDPEALLVATAIFARYDPRLFDEVLDWLHVNGRLLNIQRLKNILRGKEFRDARPVVSAIAAFMAVRHKHLKWKGLTQRPGSHDLESLFFQKEGQPLPSLQEKDATFLLHGFIRSPVSIRRLSKTFPPSGIASLLLRLRAFFGVNARPEIVLYLLSHEEGGHPTSIAAETSYAQKTVQDTLVDMDQSGLVRVASSGRRKDYYVAREEWLRFLNLRIPPEWVNWPIFFAGLMALWDKTNDKTLYSLSQEVVVAEMRDLSRRIRPLFRAAAPSLSLPDQGFSQGKNFLDEFMETISSELGV